MKPTASIIIPITDPPSCLDRCLASAAGQTVQNIEIICVVGESCETSALEIVQDYCERDARFAVVYAGETPSHLQACKAGALSSSGQVVLFLEANDYLEATACETASAHLEPAPSSVLQFGMQFHREGSFSKKRLREIESRAARTAREPFTGGLLRACFCESAFDASLFGKAFPGGLARPAFESIEDGAFPVESDSYALFLILENATSIEAIEEKPYHRALGPWSRRDRPRSLEDFIEYCQGRRIIEAIERHIAANPRENDADRNEALISIKKRIADDQARAWRLSLAEEHKPDGLSFFIDLWGLPFGLGSIATESYRRQSEIARFITKIPGNEPPRCIKSIALYYRSITGGGAERVVAQVSNMLADLKDETGLPRYKVVLVTDEAPSQDDYQLSSSIVRETVSPLSDYPGKHYEERIRSWNDVISKHGIDLVVYSQWLAPSMLWDGTAIKAHPDHPAFVVHTHGNFGLLFARKSNAVEEVSEVLRMADAVITLSRADQTFWSHVNNRTLFIPNPCSFSPRTRPRPVPCEKRVVWIGRMSSEKQPLEAVRIMVGLCERIPDVTCHFVGTCKKEIREEVEQAVSDAGLERRIFIEGFCRDVRKWYENASVLLHTAAREGYSLVLYEAAAQGLPTVMYEIPWLEYNEICDGFISVPQRRAAEATDAISKLLSDEAKWHAASEKLRRSFSEAPINEKCMQGWCDLISHMDSHSAPSEETALETVQRDLHDIELNEIRLFHSMSVTASNDALRAARRELEKSYLANERLKAQLQKSRETSDRLKARLQTSRDKTHEARAQLKETRGQLKEARAQSRQLQKEVERLKKTQSSIKVLARKAKRRIARRK